MDVQRLSQLAPMPFGMLPAFVGRLQRTAGHSDEAEIQPAAGYVVCPAVPGDDRICGRYQPFGRRTVAARPTRRAALQLRSGLCQFPPPCLRPGPRPAQPRFSLRQSPGFDTESAVSGTADNP